MVKFLKPGRQNMMENRKGQLKNTSLQKGVVVWDIYK
jgi:hypothetical protein